MCTLARRALQWVYIWAMTALNSDIARGWLHEADCRLADMVGRSSNSRRNCPTIPTPRPVDQNTGRLRLRPPAVE